MNCDLPMSQESTPRANLPGAKPPGTSTRLLIRIRDQDDPQAWREFVEQYGRRLLGFFTKRGVAREDAEELTQDVFVRISKCIPVFREQRGSAHNWIFTIASRIWIDTLRRWRRRPTFQAIKDIEPETLAAEFTEEYLDRIVEEALENTRLRLQREKPNSAERAFRIFHRNWREKVSRKQIAREVGMSEPAVGMVILRVQPVFKDEVERLIGDLP